MTLPTLLLVALGLALSPAGGELSERHRRWIDEEVVYIATDRERDVFLSLETDEERDRFIEAFWRRRDPDPSSLENEFRIEHERRLAYANEHFGREAPMPGWRTDRGRFYIVLGPPGSVQRYEGLGPVVSTEIWYYNGDPSLGLPSRFNLLFYRDQDLGPYELYHPVADGPLALLRGGAATRLDAQDALERLESVSVDLALAAILVDLTDAGAAALSGPASREPGPRFGPTPSLAADATLARILDAPRRRVDTSDLEAFLRYRDRVSAEYSFRFVPHRASAVVLPGPEGVAFVHLVVELDPEHLTVRGDEAGRYRTVLDVEIEARTPGGAAVGLGGPVPVVLTPTELERVARSPFAYEADFPLAVAGPYAVTATLKNRLTREFTVAELAVAVPAPSDGPSLSDIVAAYGERLDAAAPGEAYRTFQVGPRRLEPAAGGLFALGETIRAAVVVARARPGDRVRFALEGDAGPLTETSALVDESSGLAVGRLPTTGLAGGRYELSAELVAAGDTAAARRTTTVTLSPRTAIARPGMVFRRDFGAGAPGLLALARGEQLLLAGRVDEAIAALEAAVAAGNPALPEAHWRLGWAFLAARRPDRALAVLAPLEEEHAERPDVVEGLGLAHFLRGDCAAALPYLEGAMRLRPAGVAVLNALGACYDAAGRTEDARRVFLRSIELDPAQPALEDWLARHEP